MDIKRYELTHLVLSMSDGFTIDEVALAAKSLGFDGDESLQCVSHFTQSGVLRKCGIRYYRTELIPRQTEDDVRIWQDAYETTLREVYDLVGKLADAETKVRELQVFKQHWMELVDKVVQSEKLQNEMVEGRLYELLQRLTEIQTVVRYETLKAQAKDEIGQELERGRRVYKEMQKKFGNKD